MIDLHCHILPALDDGSPDLQTSLAMARMAVSDGISAIVCTPHITPGIYNNTTEQIEAAVANLRAALPDQHIDLELYVGADVHIAPDLPLTLAAGSVPTIAASRFFLFEPPHHVVPPRLEVLARKVIAAGFVPILTHPERLTWIDSHYEAVRRLSAIGVLVQLTAGSILGSFGSRAKSWSERMLDDGLVDLVATDSHNTTSRPPLLSRARDIVAARLGSEEATQMVSGRPAAILANDLPAARPASPGSAENPTSASRKKLSPRGNWWPRQP